VWRHLPELRFGIPDLFSIRRCVECGTCLTDPSPDQRYLEKIYQKHYVPAEYVPPNRIATVSEVDGLLAGKTVLFERWSAERSTEIPALFYQPDTSGLFAGCRMIIDVGAYTGENMLWLVAGGRTVIGVEPNPKAASVAAELGLDVRPAYVSDCNFPDALFDLFDMSYVI